MADILTIHHSAGLGLLFIIATAIMLCKTMPPRTQAWPSQKPTLGKKQRNQIVKAKLDTACLNFERAHLQNQYLRYTGLTNINQAFNWLENFRMENQIDPNDAKLLKEHRTKLTVIDGILTTKNTRLPSPLQNIINTMHTGTPASH
jgi:hypothetical protein